MQEIALKDKIYTIRGKQVMLDRDLAELYAVETRTLNQAVKRNIKRFPNDFYFQIKIEQITSNEMNLKSQNVISNWGGTRKPVFVFTQEGIAMLSGILKSERAIEVNIKIMRAFVQMRRFLIQNAEIFTRLNNIERKQIEYEIQSEQNFNQIFQAIESKQLTPNQGIFYDGQIYDAHKFITDLIKQAKTEIILLDNYVDETTLTLLANKSKGVKVIIYTQEITETLKLAKEKFNKQYKNLEIHKFTKSHDRSLVIDRATFHIGASLKDAGKKWFAFSKMEQNRILQELPQILQ